LRRTDGNSRKNAKAKNETSHWEYAPVSGMNGRGIPILERIFRRSPGNFYYGLRSSSFSFGFGAGRGGAAVRGS
jgi:hypothetical protein